MLRFKVAAAQQPGERLPWPRRHDQMDVIDGRDNVDDVDNMDERLYTGQVKTTKSRPKGTPRRMHTLTTSSTAVALERKRAPRKPSVVTPEERAEFAPASAREALEQQKKTLERWGAFRRDIINASLPVTAACKLLGLRSRQTLHNWILKRRVLAVRDNNQFYLPICQFDLENEEKIVRGLPEVLAVISHGNPYVIARWLCSKNPGLNKRSPIEALKEGALEHVIRNAKYAGSM